MIALIAKSEVMAHSPEIPDLLGELLNPRVRLNDPSNPPYGVFKSFSPE